MHARAVPYCSFQSGLRWAGEGVINPSLSASTLQRALLLTHNYVRFQTVVLKLAFNGDPDNNWGRYRNLYYQSLQNSGINILHYGTIIIEVDRPLQGKVTARRGNALSWREPNIFIKDFYDYR